MPPEAVSWHARTGGRQGQQREYFFDKATIEKYKRDWSQLTPEEKVLFVDTNLVQGFGK